MIGFSFLFFMFVLQNSMAISSDMQQNYLSAQTVVTKLSGNILQPISASQVEIKRNNVRVAWDYDIKKLGNDYYLWFITQNVQNETNYTLYIHNITTTYLGNEESVDFNQSFSVEPQLSDYYIKPGFIFTMDDFNVQVILNNDQPENINVNFPSDTTYTIQPGINNIPFSIKDASYGTGLYMIQIGQYEFPSYLIVNGSTIKKVNYVSVQPGYIQSDRLISDNNIYYQVQINNIGSNNISNLYLQYDSNLFSVNPSNNITLAPGQSQIYQITLNTPSRSDINDTFYFISSDNNISMSMPFSVNFFENASDINQTIPKNVSGNETALYSCSELLGQICSSDQVCSGSSVTSTDGICCMGVCSSSTSNTSSSGSYSWLGYLIAAIVIIGALVLYVRYKRVKPEKNPIGKKIEEAEKSTKHMP